ncbi:hypothetical protein GGR21_002950 [Dysgonomonas hofstadii]|uniref:Uncharacterized protein n=1 Tax=Dysgonomonas hofstadii TaxID=637886 RepID=A0A840CNR0_9BACT|nr:hypothetical protein [Dysgonomonas hofstadii]MBB4037036.1 hypothetical protein [Dysgonomonas hofstadii]
MANFFTYFVSRNKKIYSEIAREEKCNSFHVYYLAHGKKAKSDRDFRIISTLIQKGLVQGWHIGRNPN